MPPSLQHAQMLSAQGREQEAIALIAALAGQGDPDAMFALADLHWRGGPVPQDFGRGRTLFEQAAAAGSPVAARAVTNLLASGIAGPRDWPAAMARLDAEAQADMLRGHMAWIIGQMALTPEGDPQSLPPPEQLSEAPHVTLFRGAFTQSECDYLIIAAESGFAPSMVADGKGGDVRDPIRSSDGSTFHWLIEDPAVHAINRRLAALSGTTAEQGEALQILRYKPGQQYRPHVDWLGDTHRRIKTALIYLNDGYEGGETEFHKVGLRVRGRRGDVLVFRNEGPDGRLDPLTEHAGLPVTSGAKYLASRWIRDVRHSA